LLGIGSLPMNTAQAPAEQRPITPATSSAGVNDGAEQDADGGLTFPPENVR